MARNVNGFKVEKGVPLTGWYSRQPTPFLLTVRALNVGESFVVPAASAAAKNNYCSRVHNRSQFPVEQFATRSEGDGLRIWRLK